MGIFNFLRKKDESRKTHAMFSGQARDKKLIGHQNERDFNLVFGDRNAELNYSGPSSDCIIKDTKFFNLLKEKLKVKDKNVSLKSGNTIQIHLGVFPELTIMDVWKKNLGSINVNGNEYTTSKHGISLANQIKVLKNYNFWKKYLGKGEILCYRETKTKWIFFNMDDVIKFIIKNFEWRLLVTGRLKGDFNNKQYLTYEYRSEEHKKCFVLGAHGGEKGKEFISLLVKNIPFVEEIR